MARTKQTARKSVGSSKQQAQEIKDYVERRKKIKSVTDANRQTSAMARPTSAVTTERSSGDENGAATRLEVSGHAGFGGHQHQGVQASGYASNGGHNQPPSNRGYQQQGGQASGYAGNGGQNHPTAIRPGPQGVQGNGQRQKSVQSLVNGHEQAGDHGKSQAIQNPAALIGTANAAGWASGSAGGWASGGWVTHGEKGPYSDEMSNKSLAEQLASLLVQKVGSFAPFDPDVRSGLLKCMSRLTNVTTVDQLSTFLHSSGSGIPANYPTDTRDPQ